MFSRAYNFRTQSDLDRWVADMREENYPYLGSEDSRYQLLDNGLILWDVPGEPEWGYILASEEELADSVFCWRHDC